MSYATYCEDCGSLVLYNTFVTLHTYENAKCKAYFLPSSLSLFNIDIRETVTHKIQYWFWITG